MIWNLTIFVKILVVLKGRQEGIFHVKSLNFTCPLMRLKDYLKTNYQKVALLTAPSDSCLKKSACVKVHFSDIFEAKESKSGFFSRLLIKIIFGPTALNYSW